MADQEVLYDGQKVDELVLLLHYRFFFVCYPTFSTIVRIPKKTPTIYSIYYSAKKLKLRRVLKTLCGAFERCSRVRYNSAESEPIWMKFGLL